MDVFGDEVWNGDGGDEDSEEEMKIRRQYGESWWIDVYHRAPYWLTTKVGEQRYTEYLAEYGMRVRRK